MNAPVRLERKVRLLELYYSIQYFWMQHNINRETQDAIRSSSDTS